MQHFPFFEITGDSYEVGRRHGEVLREEIHRQLKEALQTATQQGGLNPEEALGWAVDQLPKIEVVGGMAWIDELRGLADGAQISMAEAAALQVRPGTGFMPEGCTSLAVSGESSATGFPLGGQNRDLVPAYRGRMCVLLLRPRGRSALLMHSVPGELGGVGVNAQGVAVFANSLWSRTGRNWQAPPITRRAILECTSADQAADRVRKMDGPAVGSFLVIDPCGRIRNLEIFPQALAVITPDSGVFAHANHCLDARLQPHEVGQLPSPGSWSRCTRMQTLLDGADGRVSVEEIKRMLADHSSRPEPICRHATTATEWETTSALIVEPVSRTLHLSYGPPCEARYASYKIS